jgi:hypothetical protein
MWGSVAKSPHLSMIWDSNTARLALEVLEGVRLLQSKCARLSDRRGGVSRGAQSADMINREAGVERVAEGVRRVLR